MMEDKLFNLMTRFPDAGENVVKAMLVQSDGHAGKVAAKLNSPDGDVAMSGNQCHNHDVSASCEVCVGADERMELASKDPASALLALLQAMQEHAQCCCKHGCIFRAKRLVNLSDAEYLECVPPGAAPSYPSASQANCPVAVSMNQELKELVQLVKEFKSGKENNNDRPCEQSGPTATLEKVVTPVEMHSGLRVRVVGAIGRGLEGTLRNYDEDHRRWSVVLDTGAAYYLRGADLEPTGA